MKEAESLLRPFSCPSSTWPFAEGTLLAVPVGVNGDIAISSEEAGGSVDETPIVFAEGNYMRQII
jgi:hypothetical protein